MPTPEEAEDVVLDLPPSDGGLADDTLADLDEGEDRSADDENEVVGLDVSVGFDHDSDLADLIDGADREDQRWSEGTENASELIKIDARDLSEAGDEYGWTADNEAAGDTVAHREDDLDDGDLPALGADSDEEGLGEERGGGEGDDVDLPPIDAGEPDVHGGPEALDASLLGRLDQVHEAEPDRIEVQPGVGWSWFPRSQVRVSELGQGVTGEVLHLGAQAWCQSGSALINLDSPQRAPLHANAVISQTLGDPLGQVLISTDSGLWRITDESRLEDLGGPSADPALIANARLAITTHGAQTQLWAQSRLGSLFQRMTDPERWSLVDSPRPGRHLAHDGRRTLAYVHAAMHRPCALIRSDDGGASWTSQPTDVSDASIVTGLLVCRDVAVLVTESMTAPILVTIGQESPTELLSGLRAPVALVYEDSEVVLYGCVLTADRVLLIRQPLGRPMRKPSVVQAWSASDGVLPTGLSVHHDGAFTDLVLRTGDRALRVRLVIAPDNA